MSLWVKLAALGGLLATLLGIVWYAHHHWWAEGYAQRAQQDAAELARARKVQTVIDTRVVTKTKVLLHTVYLRGATIIQKVPIYVTRYDNSRCIINVGFVRLWNDANRMSLPAPASSVDEAASSVKLSDVAAQHSREATICHANDTQLRQLQAWVSATAQAHE